jgi:hypothetical protein
MIGIVAQRAEIKKEPGLSCPGSSLSQAGSMTLIFQRFFFWLITACSTGSVVLPQ